MNYSIKKLIAMCLASSLSITLCSADNVQVSTDNKKDSTSEISDDIWQKIDKMTREDIEELFHISYDMLPFQYRKKLDTPEYKIKSGFNIQAGSKYTRSSVEKFAKKNNYKFVEVDLGLDTSIEDFKKIIETYNKDKVLIVYINTIRCSDVDSYLQDILANLKEHRFGIFVNSFEFCKDKKCLDHGRMKKYVINNFSFYHMNIDLDAGDFIERLDNVVQYRDIIKEYLKRLNKLLDNKINLTEEEINAIVNVFGELCGNYDDLEKVAINTFVSLRSKKAFDFNSLFSTLMSYVYVTPDRFDWDEEPSTATAIHEMSHAVLFKHLGFDVAAVVMASDFSGITPTLFSNLGSKKVLNYETYENLIMAFLAGRAGQEYLHIGSDLGSYPDMSNVIKLAKCALTVDDPMFKLQTEEEQKKLIISLFDKLQEKVKKIIFEHKEVIKRLADELSKKPDVNGIKFMIGSEFNRLYDQFIKESEDKKKFLEDNKDCIDKIVLKISQDPEAWNSVKSCLGLSDEEKKDENTNEVDKTKTDIVKSADKVKNN